MIIAAFTGVGKSYFAHHVADSKDFPVMPFKYVGLNNPNITKEEAERSKADPEHVLNPEWPDNYIQAVANQYHDYRYFIIPSDRKVLQGLQLLQIPYILVYPERNAKKIYQKRYIDRNNTDDFLKIFIGHWDGWMNILRRDFYGWSIELSGDRFLTDVKEEIGQIIDQKEVNLKITVDDETASAAAEILKRYDLSLAEYTRRCLIWSIHHKDETKKIFGECKGDNTAQKSDKERMSSKEEAFMNLERVREELSGSFGDDFDPEKELMEGLEEKYGRDN